MRYIKEKAGERSLGTIDEYLSGQEDYILDRRSTPRGTAGFVSVLINGNGYTATIYNAGVNRYAAFLTYPRNGTQYRGKGSNPKATFFDLLKNMKEQGVPTS